jgi:L-fucose mutarotase/ribose pyranase (RbsD/FucU family)
LKPFKEPFAMLKAIDPLLTPDLLYVLAAMGHGDEIAIVDANYPAQSAGPDVVRLDAADATRALDAVLSVLPLDTFVAEPCWLMEVVGAAAGDAEPAIFAEFRASSSPASSASPSTSARAGVSRSSPRASGGSTATSFSRRASSRRTEAPLRKALRSGRRARRFARRPASVAAPAWS